MTNLDLNDFLHSLAKFMVGRAAAFAPSVTIAYAGTPRQIWRDKVNEDFAADPYATLRIYPGPPLTWHPLPRLSLQVQAVGTDDAAALAFAWTLFQTLIEDDGKPLRMRQIDGFKAADDSSSDGTYMIVSIDPLQRPGFTGRDDSTRGRALATFNCEIGFYRLA